MKKLLLLLFSILISFNSWGEWTLYDVDINDGTAFYIEKNTIKKDSGYVYYWELIDFWEPISFTEDMMSVKIQRQVNCNNMRHRNLSISFYKKQMAMGQARDYTPSMDWFSSPPDSIANRIINFACSYASKLN